MNTGRTKIDFYSEESPYELQYEAGREIKSLKTLAIIADALNRPLSELCALEVGCFTGEISLRLLPHFQKYVAIDIDEKNIERAVNKAGDSKRDVFHVMDAERLEFQDESFDVIICSHVYEHVLHPKTMMREIHRVLRPDGICYFAAGNRLCFMEPHHCLPFLTLMPKTLANSYLNLFRKKARYNENFLFLPELRKLVIDFFVSDYTLAVLREPEKFMATDMLLSGTWKHRVANYVLPKLYFATPTYIWVLKKQVEQLDSFCVK
ncbi:MAG: class I SAM-dependent methyltransferase [Desulfuromonadales bacterium]|nr:class I SAM-dependent methyltransferase [Desulfuromonadales bacterium]